MTNPQTAVAVIEQDVSSSVVEWTLDQFPVEDFNRLIPMQTIVMPSDLFKPAYQVIQADPPDRDGKSADTYKSNDVPTGHRAPTARLLRKFSSAAGLTFTNEHRIDDGSDPEILGVTMDVSMILPTGQRITAPGSQLIDLRTWFKSDASQAEVAKFRKQFYANVQTRAMNRGIRGVLSLRSSYPEADLAKPFVVVSYVLNMEHPEVRTRVLDAMIPVTAQLYGPSPALAPMKQLAAGEPEIHAPEAAEEDPAPATPTTMPGEKLAAAASAPAEPDWITGAVAASVPTPAAAPAEVDVAALIRDTAAASGMKGPATAPQLEKLKGLLGGLTPPGVTTTALVYIWDETVKSALTAAQAQSLVNVADSLGTDEFHAAIRAIAEHARGQAA